MSTQTAVAAIVVTFNRKDLLLECLQALAGQSYPLSTVIVVDNASTDGTEAAVRKWATPSFRLEYRRLATNTGGAGGFYEGVKRAREVTADWLWLMDDDAQPESTCLETLLQGARGGCTSFLAPRIVHYDSRQDELWHHKAKIDLLRIKDIPVKSASLSQSLEANAFVGVLISAVAMNRVGLPDPSYFIWFDDTDYTYRINRACGPGRLIPDAVILHKDVLFSVPQGNWKHLYGLRNRIRFFKKFAPFLGRFVLVAKLTKQVVCYLARLDFYPASILLREWFVGGCEIDRARLRER